MLVSIYILLKLVAHSNLSKIKNVQNVPKAFLFSTTLTAVMSMSSRTFIHWFSWTNSVTNLKCFSIHQLWICWPVTQINKKTSFVGFSKCNKPLPPNIIISCGKRKLCKLICNVSWANSNRCWKCSVKAEGYPARTPC